MGFDLYEVDGNNHLCINKWGWGPIAEMIEESGIITSEYLFSNDGLEVTETQARSIADYLEAVLLNEPDRDEFAANFGEYVDDTGKFLWGEEKDKALMEGHARTAHRTPRILLKDFVQFCRIVKGGFVIW